LVGEGGVMVAIFLGEGGLMTDVVRVLEGEVLDVDWSGWSGPGTVGSYVYVKCCHCRHENDVNAYYMPDNRPCMLKCGNCSEKFEALKTVEVRYTTRGWQE
jgi:hypothetical protein